VSQNRNWREWARRWWDQPPLVDVSTTLVPVVLVDDVRALSVPPAVPYYSRFHGIPAVALEFGVLELRSVSKILEVVGLWTTNAVAFHVAVSKATGAASLTLEPTSEMPPYRFAGRALPLGVQAEFPTALLYEGTDPSPDTLYDPSAQVFVSTGCRYLATASVSAWVPILLMPGESMVVTTTAALTALSYSIIWREFPVPSGDQMATSIDPQFR
jgi:hypothetical protein